MGIKVGSAGKAQQGKPRKPARATAKQFRTPTKSSLADALFSTTQQKVFGLIFGQPDRSFFASELINLASGGSGAVQRELARLEQSGLVTSRRIGNQKHYQANPAAPVFDELTQIVAKTFGLADPIRKALQPLRDDIAWAVIYGSIAKRSDTAGSDIDLLLVGDELTLEAVFKALDPAEQQLHREINPVVLTRKEFTRRAKEHEGFVSRLVGGDRILLLGSMDAAKATR